MTIYSGVIEMGQTALNADYFVISYQFTDGDDLDTRTRMVTPVVSNYLGWGRDTQFGFNYQSQFKPILWWGGDNTGTGFESVLFDVRNYRLFYSNNSFVQIELRAFWYSTPGLNPVKVTVTGYRGGSMFISNFEWTNTSFEEKYSDFTSVSKVVTLFTQNPSSNGQFIAGLNLNFGTGQVSFSTV